MSKQLSIRIKRSHAVNKLKMLRAELDCANKARDGALREAELKSHVLASVSHEIRTPMNAVIGMSELLLNEPLTGRQLRYVNDIHTASTALLGIINNALDFSKIEAGKLTLVARDFNLPVLLDNIVSMMHFIAADSGVELKAELDGDLPGWVYGDDLRLRQALVNIMGNAIKFTRQGYVRLTAQMDGGSVVFVIEDTGVGIRGEDIPRLFVPFEQMDRSINRQISGTGLGLAITKSIIELMDGKISVESSYGEGTRFRVELPITEGTDNSVETDEADFGYICTAGVRALVVDDIEMNLNVMSGLLERAGAEYDVAAGGREAVELVQRNDYDIVFMDHIMPDIDGKEATSLIRAMGGKYLSMAIVALTANIGAREQLVGAGMSDFLAKPVERRAFNEILYRWLPAEKITGTTDKPEPEALTPELEAAARIAELDIPDALSRIGSAEAYQDSLKFFCLINENMRRKLSSLVSGEASAFAVEIHGARGYLATIGAKGLADEAQEIEAMAKAGEMEHCGKRLDNFLERYGRLGAELSEIFGQSTNVRRGGTEELLTLLAQARESLDAYMIGDAQDIMKKIDELYFDGETDRELRSLSELVRHMDYSAAKAAVLRIETRIRG